MRNRFSDSLLVLALLAAPALAQQHEVGLTLGALLGADRGALELGSGVALQANYGYRLAGGETVALYGEIHFLAGPLREVSTQIPNATRDVASLYLTPGIRVKFRPNAAASPYFVLGGGYALYEHSELAVDGSPNTAPRLLHRGAFMFGGGVDFRFWRFVRLRAEVRDFYTGNPAYNVPVSGGQHNVVAGGGIVLTFR